MKKMIFSYNDLPRAISFFFDTSKAIMNEQVIAIYCICDEIVKSLGLTDDSQSNMTSAEIMDFALISALYYHADYRTARLVSISCKYFKNILSHSRLVRRIHSIPEQVWWMIFYVLKMYLRKADSDYFIVDSFPIKAYENHKSFRAKIFKGKEFHEYSASKKTVFLWNQSTYDLLMNQEYLSSFALLQEALPI